MQFSYSAFVGESHYAAKGNICGVSYFDTKPEDLHELISKEDKTHCVVWRSSSSTPLYEIMCSKDRHVIECCGHGLLCAASHLFLTKQHNEVSFFINGRTVQAKQSMGKVWLRFSRLLGETITPPTWTHKAFSFEGKKISLCERATLYGGDTGYLLLEWPKMTDLRSMTVSSAQIVQSTNRALICVAPTSDSTLLNFRYFAPQYGPVEDMATGSAARVVASHFDGKFILHQVSKDGGLMHVNRSEKHVEVGGLYKVN